MLSQNPTLEEIVNRCEAVMSHAWMVRTFVKHSEEAEDFPELMNLARTVFDSSRAMETRVNDPAGYLQMLRKKIGKLEKAAAQFRQDAPQASTHMNFQQAVHSMDACVAELRALLTLSADVGRDDVGRDDVGREVVTGSDVTGSTASGDEVSSSGDVTGND